MSKYRAWLEHLVYHFSSHTKDGERRLNNLVSHTEDRNTVFSMGRNEHNKVQSCLEALISEFEIESLSKEARLLLETLLENYLRRGSTYLYAHVLLERHGWGRVTLQRTALELKSYGLMYLRRDGKIGLRKRVQSLASSLC